MRCLGNWGKLLEIGKYDILKGTPLSMRPMLNNISFEGIDVDRVMNHSDSTEVLPQPEPLPCTTRSSSFAVLCVKVLSRSLLTPGAELCCMLQLAELNQLVADGLASGEVKPLPVTVFPRTEIEEAFRYMASGTPLQQPTQIEALHPADQQMPALHIVPLPQSQIQIRGRCWPGCYCLIIPTGCGLP